MDYVLIKNDELYHHGILGQKWGVRRYQNADGSLTKAGLKRRDKYAKKLGKYNTNINQYKYEAATADNPFLALKYEYDYQLFWEQKFDETLSKMKKELGSDNIGKLEDNPYYKKYAKKGEEYYKQLVAYNNLMKSGSIQKVQGGYLVDPALIFGPDWDKDK